MKTQTVQDTIEKNQWFPHPIEKVWEALTKNEHVSQWLAPTDFNGEAGKKYALHSKEADCDVVEGVVKEASPYTLIYSWTVVNHRDVETEVRWDLTKENDGTRVVMIHSGISKYEKQAGEQMFANFSGGWKRCFDQIEEVLNQ